jgi:hypothetical protein
MTLAEAKARANKTFITQASLTIVSYNNQNIAIVHRPQVSFALLANTVKA